MRRGLVLIALLSSLAVPAIAAAATKQLQVTSTVEWRNGQRPTDAGNCVAAGFAQWKHVENATSALVRYSVKTSTSPRAESVSRAGPGFDNDFDFVASFDVTPGYDWVNFTKNWRDGPGVDDCSAALERLKGVIVGPVTVELTVAVDEKACAAARAALTKKQQAVTRLQGRVNRARGKEKARLKRALKAAKKSRDVARARVADSC